jgi:hypothetical protein
MINVRNRQYISDGKTGGYPTLQSIWWKYIEQEQTINVPNNKYTYQKLIDYVNGIGPYWMKLIEQMIPATTIWNTGVRMENSIFQKQKFVYRRQRGCEFIPVPVEPCFIISNIFDFTCAAEYVDYFIYPWLNGDVNVSNFSSILANRVNSFLATNNLTLNDCIQSSTQTQWYVDLRIGGDIIILENFYNGYGYDDVPTNQMWRNALIQYLPNLYDYGYTYFLNGNLLTITSLTCEPRNLEDLVSLNTGINISINCNNKN